jgi:hypothetical protein
MARRRTGPRKLIHDRKARTMQGQESRTRTMPAWVDPAARMGHAAKGTVYAAVGALALWGIGGAGESGGGRAAIRAIAGAPIGKALIALLAVGLAAYVLWRLSQAMLPPEDVGWGRRGLYLLSAAIHAALAVFAVQLLVGSGVAADPEGPSRLARILTRPRGPWIVGAVGAGLLVRGILRLARPYSHDFRSRIESLDLPAASRRWVASVSRIAVTARGLVLLTIGGSLLQAAAAGAPVAAPSRTALLGACLFALALLEWTRARYPLPDA